MAQHARGGRPPRDFDIGVANTRRLDLEDNFIGSGIVKDKVLDNRRRSKAGANSGADGARHQASRPIMRK